VYQRPFRSGFKANSKTNPSLNEQPNAALLKKMQIKVKQKRNYIRSYHR
jgi:hypothetical protein